MSKLTDLKVLTFHNFEKIDGSTSVVYEIAWPVEVVECYANKVSSELDALAETVLELLNVPEMTKKQIAEYLMVSDEVVGRIISDLSARKFYDSEKKCITENGAKYLHDYEMGEFCTDKVFGNMFISLMDGEVFPYFYQEKLPWATWNTTALYLSFDRDIGANIEKNKDLNLADKINRAYHEHGRINRMSKDRSHGCTRPEIDFYEEELHEISFREVETLADAEERRDIKNARIKILNTERRRAYIRTRFVVKKANPEQFIVESPFPHNYTSWYSDCFRRMRDDNALIYGEESEEVGLDFFCENITTKFYADYPEMQSRDFNQYLKIHFQNMRSTKAASIFIDKYHEVFNLNILCDEKKQVKRHTVITECAKAIELILNNYIASVNKNDVIRKYQAVVRKEPDIDVFFDAIVEIPASKAKDKELYAFNNREKEYSFRSSIMYSFSRKNWAGKTIVEKYYFLLVDAYFNEDSRFRRLLVKEGESIIRMIDYMNDKRNKYGAHSDGVRPPEISDAEYRIYQDYFKKITRMLIEYID